jgi:3-deoxy-7-phosphoheptulonate synthase
MQIENINIVNQDLLITSEKVKQLLPLSEKAKTTVEFGRIQIQSILDHQDPRLFVIVGPCSVHDVDAAIGYASRLRDLAEEIKDTIVIVMRVYFEKPRTTVGWKGLINDPLLNGSFMIEEGLIKARKLLLSISELGLPIATEALDPISVQYLSDLISWYAIGARTTESQVHRDLASGLSAPVGFKNGTDGSLDIAINAMVATSESHRFLGVDPQGRCAVTQTRGNKYAHIVLRGSDTKPNYDSATIAGCKQQLEEKGLRSSLVVDCSHGNSGKDPSQQPYVLRDCISQIVNGSNTIVGLMLESFLNGGSQPMSNGKQLKYGVSITDACLDWETTEHILREAHQRLLAII